VAFSKSVLFRGAGLDVVWPHLLGVAATGSAFFLVALWRFRASVAAQR
jgi:ABC-2 type transport system permease protein